MKNTSYQFSQPYIVNSIFRTNENFDAGAKQSIEISTKPEKIIKRSKDNPLLATVGLTITIGEESKKSPFYLKLTMCADFTWEDKSDEEVNKFLSINAPALIVGYMRPIIALITSNSKFPTFNIPFINFVK